MVKILNFKFCGGADVWLRFLLMLVEILKMKCEQDLCLNLCSDFKKLLWQDELNPRVRCAFGNVSKYEANANTQRPSFKLVLINLCLHFMMTSGCLQLETTESSSRGNPHKQSPAPSSTSFIFFSLGRLKPNNITHMAFKTTHNKDESLPQFMKSPQLIFSHN